MSFIKGLELNRGFYFDVIKPLLDMKYPNLNYSASLLGYGSDVLGYDTEISMDHNWGPRLQLFVDDESIIPELNEFFGNELPFQYKDFPVNFSKESYDHTVRMECTDKKPINHLIEIATVKNYFMERYSLTKTENFSLNDWLNFSDQKLIEITSGSVFHDGLGKINRLRDELSFYPMDISKLRMAVLWNYIWNKEAFIGRSIELNDFIGLKINVSRIINYLIKVLFYLEKRYIPYSKWFGHAFKELTIYNDFKEPVQKVLKENVPEKIEEKICKLYEKVIEEHNKNDRLPCISNKPTYFFGRPYKVIMAEKISDDLLNSIEDEEVKKINVENYAYDIILDL